MNIEYSQTSTNGHLSTKAASLQRPRLYIDFFVDLSTMATIICPQSGHCGEIQLIIIPRARMGSESVGLMGYWLRGHKGKRNNRLF